MLAKLDHHRQTISIALMAVMLLSVLLFCPMTVDAGQIENPYGGHVDMPMADMMSDNPEMSMHDCCKPGKLPLQQTENNVVCPDCEAPDQVLQPQISDLQPVYMLLYVVLLQELNQLSEPHRWQIFNEPDLLSSQPDIYLAKASFLE